MDRIKQKRTGRPARARDIMRMMAERQGEAMEWTESIRGAIDYMERHLLETITPADVAASVYLSSFYLQKGFKLLTGYSLGEYIRGRRLYLAALEVIAGGEKIIDLAYRYGYDTPESFTKAFTRFHGLPLHQLKRNAQMLHVFLPLKIKITIQGGNVMDCRVEKMEGFRVIGFERVFSADTSYGEIPAFWDEIYQGYIMPLYSKPNLEGEMEETIVRCRVGEYGICIDDMGDGNKFRYLIAGEYRGGPVPAGMTVYEFPEMIWAKFDCRGPMPGALQAVNTKIFQEWLPGNPDYEIAWGANVEWYSGEGNGSDLDYQSAIWIPVKRKKR